jgi:hypothetical protein
MTAGPWGTAAQRDASMHLIPSNWVGQRRSTRLTKTTSQQVGRGFCDLKRLQDVRGYDLLGCCRQINLSAASGSSPSTACCCSSSSSNSVHLVVEHAVCGVPSFSLASNVSVSSYAAYRELGLSAASLAFWKVLFSWQLVKLLLKTAALEQLSL